MPDAPPIPTPYDILPLPRFAFVPEAQHWLVLIAVLLIFAVFSRLMLRRRNADGGALLDERTAIQRLEQLAEICADGGDPAVEALFSASLIVRRALSSKFDRDLTRLTCTELKMAFDSTPLRGSALQSAVLKLERLKYVREEPHEWGTAIRACARELRSVKTPQTNAEAR